MAFFSLPPKEKISELFVFDLKNLNYRKFRYNYDQLVTELPVAHFGL